jgi:hypothetical protein
MARQKRDIEERKEGPRGNTKGAMKKYRKKSPIDKSAYLQKSRYAPKRSTDTKTHGHKVPPGYRLGQREEGGQHLTRIPKGEKGHTPKDFYSAEYRDSKPLSATPRIPSHSRKN